MSNRWVFLAAFLTATFMVAGAFGVFALAPLSPLFYFELAKPSIFIAIAVMVFFGENRYSYMLGTILVPIWFLVDLLGGFIWFIGDFSRLFQYLGGFAIGATVNLLDGIARLAATFLFVVSLAAWRREVNERYWGKTFWACLVIAVVYVVSLPIWYVMLFPVNH